MSNPVATIGLTYGGTDIQQNPIGIFLEIVRGLSESPSVRGTDTIVPALAGRIARNRMSDVLRIELVGLVAGSGTAATAAETGGGADTTLTADSAPGATVIVVASATGIADGNFLRVGDTGETEIRAVATGGVAGLNVTLTAGLLRGHDSGDQVREVDGAGTSGEDASFRTLAKAVRALFDPAAAPASLVATLEDGTTATVSARTLNTVWDQITPALARVSIELEAVADWAVA